ncbi:MAG: EF-hand domain-containing protein [Rubrivivax sp.]
MAVIGLSAAAFGIQAQGSTPSGGGLDSKQVAAAFKRVDTNQDGKLSREEAARLPAVAERFEALDKDRDGALTMDEFSAGFASGK